ncbi:MAG: hypothetical protein OXH68_02415 [Gammaproteobacteria bacterium]|nr:hypothetical protein [Gammaproteobacteria bacterium]
MSRTITQRELRNDSEVILREVQAGAAMIVTRTGCRSPSSAPCHSGDLCPER